MDNQGPSWPTAFVALGFLAFLGLVFVVVYNKDGMDGATKAWALIGTIVGVVTGAIPSYFFHQAATNAQRDSKAAALVMNNDPDTLVRFQELRAKM